MSHKDNFFHVSGRVTINDCVFLRVQTTTVSWVWSITAIGKTRRITIVSDREYFAKIGTCYYRPYLKTIASRSFGQRLG